MRDIFILKDLTKLQRKLPLKLWMSYSIISLNLIYSCQELLNLSLVSDSTFYLLSDNED